MVGGRALVGSGKKELLTVVHALRNTWRSTYASPHRFYRLNGPWRTSFSEISQRQARWSENQRLPTSGNTWVSSMADLVSRAAESATEVHSAINTVYARVRAATAAAAGLCFHLPCTAYCTLPCQTPRLSSCSTLQPAPPPHRPPPLSIATGRAHPQTRQRSRVCYNFSTWGGNWTTAVHDQPGATPGSPTAPGWTRYRTVCGWPASGQVVVPPDDLNDVLRSACTR
jgi:hypothetical protein